MNLYKKTLESGENCFVALFGLGLIGSAISRALQSRGWQLTAQIPYSWVPTHQLEDDSFIKKIEELGSVARFHWIWAAGSAGFGSSETAFREELLNFQRFLRLVERINLLFKDYKDIYFFSSAGALHLGQTLVESPESARASNKYGELKLAQEKFLQSANLGSVKICLRPSSVFGPLLSKARMGLIPVMLKNALSAKLTPIIGYSTTRRDYIFSEDVGNYIARAIDFVKTKQSPETFQIRYLVESRSMSIFEIKNRMELYLSRPTFVRYQLNPTNSQNICFSPKIKAEGFQTRPFEVCLKAVRDSFYQLESN
jgi:nucleoside-diphosphate-sugar epimerase